MLRSPRHTERKKTAAVTETERTAAAGTAAPAPAAAAAAAEELRHDRHLNGFESTIKAAGTAKL